MDTIISVVRNLVFLVLATTFLEMLLPLRETRRYLQVVMGLFVMIAVLNPVVSLFRQSPLLGYRLSPYNSGEQAQLRNIISQGQDLQQTDLKAARQDYIGRLQDEAVVLARLVPGVNKAEAKVVLDDSSSLSSMGEVQKVSLTVWPESGVAGSSSAAITPVQSVDIGNNEKSGAQESAPVSAAGISSQVKSTVASLFGLQTGQVEVNIKTTR